VPFVENQGAKIYWDERGTGEPVLLIMGLGWTSHMWYRTRKTLDEAGYRTIVFDNRGVGQSSVPAGPYPLPVMASDAAAVLAAAGAQRAHVYGVSMGGMIAQELALLYPDRVATLVLGCTQAGGATAVQPDMETMGALMRDDLSGEEAARAVSPFIYSAATPNERIEEDLAVRLPWLPTRRVHGATAGRVRVGVAQPARPDSEAGARDARRRGPARAVRKRKSGGGADRRIEIRHAARSGAHFRHRLARRFRTAGAGIHRAAPDHLSRACVAAPNAVGASNRFRNIRFTS
jgi:pimeloyl-ACP methyl ester carboxylesterase